MKDFVKAWARVMTLDRGVLQSRAGTEAAPPREDRYRRRSADADVTSVLRDLTVRLRWRFMPDLKKCGAGYGDRTRLTGLGSQGITTMLSPRSVGPPVYRSL